MKFLFAMYQGGGNVPLIAPVVARLVTRGHTVRVLAGPSIFRNRLPLSAGFINTVSEAGAILAPFQDPASNPFEQEPPVRGLIRGWVPAALAREERQARFTLWSPSWAENVSQEIQRSRPDAVVVDFFLLGALAAAEAARVPSAALVHNIPPPLASGMPPRSQGFFPSRNLAERLKYRLWNWAIERILIRDGLEAHNEARSQLGLAHIKSTRDQFANTDRVLMLVSKSFDFPARRLPTNVRYVGTPIDDTELAGTWLSPWPTEDKRPLLLVSFSTNSQGQAPVITRILKAVVDLPIRVLVTLGPSLRKEDFEAPPNAVLEAFVPHSAVLPHASAVVSQCGLGTLIKALSHGLPVVCMPLGGDQPDNAARVVSKGAGLRLSRDASVQDIRTAIADVIERPAYREAAERFARLIATEDGAETAAAELESLASLA